MPLRRLVRLSAAVFALGFAAAAPLAAQTASLASAALKLQSSGSVAYTAVAVAPNGDIFAVTGGVLDKYPANGVTPVAIAVSGGSLNISSLAIDPATGNLYIADKGDGVIDILDAGATTATSAGVTGAGTPVALAVGGSGTLYGASSTKGVFSAALTGGAANIIDKSSPEALDYTGIAADHSGNVFVADNANGEVGYYPSTYTTGSPTAITAASFTGPNQLAVDTAGNLYVADTGTAAGAAGDGQLVEITAPTSSPAAVVLESTSLDPEVSPDAVAVDSAGRIYWTSIANGAYALNELSFGSLNFSGVAVNSTGPAAAFTYDITTSGTLGTPLLLTQGASIPDYADAGSSTCFGAKTAPATCVVNVHFAPTAPGLRMGAVALVDGGGNRLATTFIAGTGAGPASTFLIQDESAEVLQGSVSPGGNSPRSGVAVDAAGDVYYGKNPSSGTSTLMEIPAGTSTPVAVASTLSGNWIDQIAVDGAGDIYWASVDSNQIYRVDGGTKAVTQLSGTTNTPLSAPHGVAVDGVGNLYIADTGNDHVYEVPVAQIGSADDYISFALPTHTIPYNVAFDNLGHLLYTNTYTSDASSGTVWQLDFASSAVSLVATPGDFDGQATGLAVDGSGAFYVADDTVGVVKYPPGGGTAQTLDPVQADIAAHAVAVDGLGNVYFTDINFPESLYVLPLATPAYPPPFAPYLSFSSVPLGGQSNLFGTALILGNAGNQNLVISALNLSNYFVQVSSGGTDCTATTSLVFATSCNIKLTFEPTYAGGVGSYEGTLTIGDNNLNANSTQTVSLMGYGSQTATQLAFTGAVPSGAFVNGNLGSVQVTVEDENGVAVATNTDTITVTITGPGLTSTSTAAAVAGVATVNLSAIALPQAGTYTVTATDGSTGYTAATASVTTYATAATAAASTVGTPVPSQAAALFFPSGGTIGSVAVVSAAGDFAENSTTCAIGTAESAGYTCTVTYTFTPQAPGARKGAAVAYDGSGHPLATVYLSGLGQGALAAFPPVASALATLTGGGGYPAFGIDTDGTYLYVSQTNAVEKVAISGGAVSAVAAMVSSAQDLKLDGAGNLYFLNYTTGVFECVRQSDGTYAACAPILPLSSPRAMAVDANGNVFGANNNASTSQLYEYPASGGSPITLASGDYNAVGSVGVDQAGNVYYGGPAGLNQISAANIAAGAPYTATPLGVIGTQYSFIFDAAGNLYTTSGDQVVEYAKSGATTFAAATTLATIPGDTFRDLAIDPSGNLYAADSSNGQIVALNIAPPSFTYPATAIGQPSAAQTTTVTNLGNIPLAISSARLSDPTDFADSGNCNGASLGFGGAGTQNCTVSIVFTPQSATVVASEFDINDNYFFNPLQKIVISAATGLPLTLTATSGGDQSAPVSTAFAQPLTVTVTDANGAVAGVTVTFTAGSNSGASATSGGNATTTAVTNGSGAATANFIANATTGGQYYVTASAALSSSTASFVLTNFGAATHFELDASGTSAAAAPVTLSVYARDQFNNRVFNFSDPVTVTATDPRATIPACSALSSGFGNCFLTLFTAGAQTITVTDSSNSAIQGTAGVTVTPLAVSALAFSNLPDVAQNGVPITVTVSPVDAYGNLTTDPATVTLSTPNGSFSPTTLNLSGGAATSTVTLTASGNQTLTANDGTNSGSAIVGVLPLAAAVHSSATITVNLTNAGAAAANSVAVLTQGIAGKDFTESGTDGCSGIAIGQSCTVTVQFQPTVPGLRMGAVELLDASNNVLQAVFLSGTGQGPAIAFTPASQGAATTTIDTININTGGPLALDGAGDIYFGDGSLTIVFIPAGHATGTDLAFTPSGDITALAVDGAGNLYVTDTGTGSNGALLKIPFIHGAADPGAISTLNNTLGPNELVVDGAGNVYFSTTFDDNIYQITPAGTQTTVATLSFNPSSLTMDGAGNIYATNFVGTAITRIAAGTYTQSSYVSGLSGAYAAAANSIGDLFVAEAGSGTLLKISAGSLTSTTLATGIANFKDFTLDAAGNIYYTLSGSAPSLLKLDLADAPTVPFSTTQPVGVISAAVTSTVSNVGNADLQISTVTATPSEFTATTGAGTCAAATLTAGGGTTCTLGATFTPDSATSFTGGLAVADNSYNGASQTLPLMGAAVLSAATVTLTPPTPTYGTAATVGVSVAGGGAGYPTPTGTVNWTLDGAAQTAATLASGATTLPLPGTLAAGSHTVVVTYAGDAAYSALSGSGGETVAVVVGKATLAVTLLPQSLPYGSNFNAAPSFTSPVLGSQYTLSGFFNGDSGTSGAVSGAPVLATTAGAASPVAGSYTITATPGSLTASNYTFNTAATAVLTITPAVLTVTANYQKVALNTAPALAGQYTITGFLNTDDVSVVSGAAALSVNSAAANGTVVGHFPIRVDVTGLTAANYSFIAGTPPGYLDVVPYYQSFGTVTSGPGTQSSTLTFLIANAGTVAQVNVLTGGKAGGAYGNAGAGTCAAQAYNYGDTCTVDVTFATTGLTAGTLPGAVVLANSAGQSLGTILLSANVLAPTLGFTSAAGGATVALLDNSADYTHAAVLARDGAGDIFFPGVAGGNGVVLEYTPGNPGAIATAYNSGNSATIVAVALDGAGDLYTADSAKNVTEIPLENGVLNPADAAILLGDASVPNGLLVDAAGDIFVSEAGDVFERPAGAYSTTLLANTLLSAPAAMALDPSGNLYVADSAAGVYEIPLGGTLPANPLTPTLVIAASGVSGIATDAAGELYIANPTSGAINVYQNVAGTFTAVGIRATNPNGYVSGALLADASGNLYAANLLGNGLYTANVQAPTTLALGHEPVTQASAAASQTLVNLGNIPLTPVSASIGTDGSEFAVSQNGCNAAITPAAACAVSVTFTPSQAGARSGTLVLGSNDPLLPSASVPLSGTGTFTTTTLGFTPAVPVLTYGAAFSPVVTAATPGSGSPAYIAPTGTFSYVLDSNAPVTANLASGSATLSLGVLATGSHTLAVTYSGDASYAAITAATTLSFSVAEAAAAVAPVVSPVSPVAYGTAQTASVTLAAAGGGAIPTGSITFTVDGAGPGTTVALGGGVANFALGSLTGGAHTLNASYSGDANYASANATQLALNVTTAVPTVSVSSPAATVTYGTAQTTAVSLAAIGAGVVPTGTLTYAVDGGTAQTATLVSGGATLSLGTLSGGGHALAVSYNGDGNYTSASAAPFTLTVNQATAVVAPVAAPAVTVTYGMAQTAAVTLAATGTGAIPTGTLTYAVDGGTVQTATLASGMATLALGTLGGGPHTLAVTYNGDGNYASASATPLALTVNQATAAVAPVAAPSAVVAYGTAQTAAVTLVATGTGAVPTGTLTYTVDGGTAQAATLAGGAASLPLGTLLGGSHTLAVTYNGDTNYAAATAAPLALTVNQATAAVTPVASPSASVTYGTPQSATVTLAAIGTGTAPTGTLTYTMDGGTGQTATLASGAATFPLGTLTAGTHTLAVTYNGDSNYASAAAAPLSLTVGQALPTLSWSPSVTRLSLGSALGDVLDAISSIPGTITYGIGSSPVTATSTEAVGAYIITATLAPSDATDYAPATASVPVAVVETSASLGNVSIGLGSYGTATVTFLNTTAAPLAVNSVAVHDGDIVNGNEFVNDGSDTCSGTSLAVGATCSVLVGYSPLSPGLRQGAAVLLDAGNHTLATIYLYGTGTGPLAGFPSGVQGTLTPGVTLANPSAVAMDAEDAFYIADSGNGRILKNPFGTSTSTVVGSGFANPTGVALDGAGNIYVADQGNTASGGVFKIPADGTATMAVGSGFSHPGGVAVDGVGNVYVADTGNNRVVEISTLDGSQTVLADATSNGLNAPLAVALDSNNNLYIADSGNNRIVTIPAGGGTAGTVGSNLSAPAGVAVDGAGNVFIADTGHNQVVMALGAGGAQQTVFTGLASPRGVAVGYNEEVAVANTGANQVQNETLVSGHNVNLSAIYAGTTGSGNALVYNLGNLPMTLGTPTLSGDPSITLAPAATNPCGTVLAAGAFCNIGLGFAPTSPSSSIVSLLTVFDNSANNASGSQQMDVIGVANARIPAAIAVSAGNNQSTTVGTAFATPLQVLVTDASSVPVPNTPVTFIVEGNAIEAFGAFPANANPVSATTDANGIASAPALTANLISGQFTVMAQLSGVGSATFTLTNNPQAQTITFAPLAAVTYGAGVQTLGATASSGLAVGYTVSGPARLSGSTLTITGAGTVEITANQAGNQQYAAAPAVTQSLVVAPAPLTVAAVAARRAYQAANPTFTASITGFVNGESANQGQSSATSGALSLTTTATTVSPAGAYPITAAAGTFTAPNYAITYVPAILTVAPAAQTITFSTVGNQTYGAAPVTLNAVATSGLAVTYTATGPASVTTTAAATTLAVTGAGAVTVTASQAGNGNYNAATAAVQTLQVSPAVATVTANPATRAYNTANPAFTASLSGLVNGDTAAVVSGAAALSTTAATTSAAGSYPITAALGTLSAANYTFVFAPGTLTITAAAQTITFPALGNQVYGAAPLSLAATADSGLAVSYAVSGPAALSGGTLAITGAGAVTVTASQAGNGNYNAAAPTAQTLRVSPAVATVTANPATRAYNTANPVFTASLSGLVNGDTAAAVSGAAALSTTATTASGVGNYAIAVAQGTLSAANYTFAFVPGTLAVTPAAQTITFATVPSTVPGAVVTLNATASSGLAVTFKVVSGAASVSGSQLSVLGAGNITVEADQAGNANYLPAPAVDQTFSAGAPAVSLSAAGLNFGAQTVATSSAAQTIVVANSGTAPLHIGAVAASSPFAETNNCATVAAGASCSVGVTFTPNATGAVTGTLTLTDDAAGSPQTVTLAGVGAAPGISVSPAVITFGGQPLGTSSTPQGVTIANTGTAPLLIAGDTASGDFAVASACATVPAGSSCSLNVTFTPTAAGARTGTLTLADNSAAGSQAITLTGTGTAAGVSLTPTALAFPSTLVASASYPEAVTLTNTGTAALTGIGIAVQGDFSQANACAASLAAGASCSINVSYNPTLAGAESGTLTVSDNLGQQPVALSGLGLAPGVNLSPALLVFGGQPTDTFSTAQTVFLTNNGTGPLAISSVAAPSGFADSTNCVATLAAGASCSINVGFTPVIAGQLSGTVTITDNAGTQTIAASGVGTAPGLALTPSAVAFGAQQVSTASAAQTLTLSNTGTMALTLAPRVASGDFTEADACPAVLTPAASCQLSLAFTPTALGARTGSVSVTDVNVIASTIASLSGTGTLPGIAAAPALVAFGSQTVGSASAAQTVTVTNTGSAALTINAVSVTGDFNEASNCTAAPLAPGANCVVSLTMTPTTAGTRTGTLYLFDNADGLHAVSLSGVGQEAGISLSSSAVTFGSAPLPASGSGITLSGTPQTVTLTNSGTLPLAIAGIGISGDFTQTNTCAASIAAGGSCTINITFVPTGLGQRTGTLAIANNSASGIQTIALIGFGSPTGLTLSPSAFNFGGGAVGVASAPQTATLTNATGSAINDLALSASGEFTETNTCGTTLANGASCTVSVVLTPLTASGITGSIGISGTLADGGTSSFRGGGRSDLTISNFIIVPSLGDIALAGSGNPAAIGLSSAALSFTTEPVGTASAAQTVTITNTGSTAALTALAIASTPDFPETATCTATLAAGTNCTVSVAFDPTAAGVRSGALTITAGGGLSAQVALSGTATGGLLTVAPGTLAFGARPVGTLSAAQSVSIGNTGTAPLTLQTVAVTGGGFSLAATTCGTLPATLAANATCTASVTYTPSSAGASSGSLAVTAAGSGGSAVIALSGSGNNQGLQLSATLLSFPTQGVGLASGAQTVTLTNPGAAAVAITSIAASGDFGETNNCPASLGGDAICSVAVVFAPTASGALAGNLVVVDSGATQSVVLSGTGANYTAGVASGSASATVDGGGPATYRLAYTPGAFTGTLSLACSGLPNGAACSFAPASLNLVAGAAASATVLTITTTARAAVPPGIESPNAPPSVPLSPRFWLFTLAGLMAMLALLLVVRRLYREEPRRRPLGRQRWAMGLLVAGALVAAGCGGVANTPTAGGGTPAGTYIITVISTAGTSAQTVAVTLSVN